MDFNFAVHLLLTRAIWSAACKLAIYAPLKWELPAVRGERFLSRRSMQATVCPTGASWLITRAGRLVKLLGFYPWILVTNLHDCAAKQQEN